MPRHDPAWVVRHEQTESGIEFWVVEHWQGSLGFACYSVEAATEAARILNAYQRARDLVHGSMKISIHDNLGLYKMKGTSTAAIAEKGEGT